jgi:hypothetical protein
MLEYKKQNPEETPADIMLWLEGLAQAKEQPLTLRVSGFQPSAPQFVTRAVLANFSPSQPLARVATLAGTPSSPKNPWNTLHSRS